MSKINTRQDFRTVRYFRAPDDERVVAIFISGDFDEFEKFPPYLDTEEDRKHLADAYQNTDPETERRTKAHMTDDSWPLQVIMLEREPGATTLPHYHVPTEDLPPHPTRHELLLCQRGSAKVGIYTIDGDHLDDVLLRRDDMVLLLEGHLLDFLEPKTRIVEIKQGPFPDNDKADKVDLKKIHETAGATKI